MSQFFGILTLTNHGKESEAGTEGSEEEATIETQVTPKG